jgi:hypothetical protein
MVAGMGRRRAVVTESDPVAAISIVILKNDEIVGGGRHLIGIGEDKLHPCI